MARLLLHHGWLHDATDMAPLLARLRAAGHVAAVVERGYFGPPAEPELEPGDDWIAVGHSLGYALALAFLRARGVRARGGIALAGFRRFPAAPERIAELRAELARDPAEAYRRFRRRCGYPPGEPRRTPSPEGLARLLADLASLAACDEPAEATPTLALHGTRDRIVPAAHALEETSRTQARLLVGGGHALAGAFADFCARECVAHLAELEAAPSPAPAAPAARTAARAAQASGDPIAAAFSAAADTYDAHAAVQREAARALVGATRGFLGDEAASVRRVADLGAGTGLTARELRAAFPDARIAAYDFAPGMIARLRANFADDPSLAARVADAQDVVFAEPVDLCASSFCWQWFADFAASAAHHLRQSRRLAIALPIEGTFATWRASVRAAGGVDRVRRFLSAEELVRAVEALDAPRAEVRLLTLDVEFPDARAFLRGVRAIGAQTAAPAVEPRGLRAALRAAPRPFREMYRVAVVLVRSPWH